MKKLMTVRSGLITMTTGVLAGFGFTGLASAQATITDTGPDSFNKISSNNQSSCTVTNTNNVDVINANAQFATTGSVFSTRNTNAGGDLGWQNFAWSGPMSNWPSGNNSVGGLSSGNASNSNQTSTNVDIMNNGDACETSAALSNGGQGGGMISDTGPNSTNVISSRSNTSTRETNQNSVGVGNFSGQSASSGSVVSSGNTNAGGSGGSGNAMNNNETETAAAVNNGGQGGGMVAQTVPVAVPISAPMSGSGGSSASISDTGPDSTNVITSSNSSRTTVSNRNSVDVDNVNLQSAHSGNVVSSHNTNAGSGSSGNASNWNAAETNVSLVNS